MSEEQKKYSTIFRYAGLATQWMAMLLAAFWIGWQLDYKWIAWKLPVFLICLPLLALVFSLWQLIREFNKPKK